MSAPAIVIVVAVAENGVIGARGGLPWRVRADLRRFRAVTMGKPLVMGRKTFESIGRVLDGRDNIVITRRADFAAAGAIVAGSVEEALAIGADRAAARRVDEICIGGGGDVFAATLPLAQRLHVTHVTGSPEGDVHFPPIRETEWEEVSRETLPFTDGDTDRATYVIYKRRA